MKDWIASRNTPQDNKAIIVLLMALTDTSSRMEQRWNHSRAISVEDVEKLDKFVKHIKKLMEIE